MKKHLQHLAALSIIAAGNVMAAVPAEVTTAIEDGVADGKSIAYALLTFAIAVGVIMYIKGRVR